MANNPCPVCEHPVTSEFLIRDSVPVHQNLLFPTRVAARSLTRGRLAMHVCEACGFVFNAAFDPRRLDYGASYDNSQNCSPAFNTYLDELVGHLVVRRGVTQGRIVEVGCGKGVFLRKLVSHAQCQCEGIGFDPTYVGPTAIPEMRLRFVRQFYGPETAVPADVVVSRHVIEHVPDPVSLLRTIRAAVGDAGSTRIFFETPCVDWILRNQVPWDFFYEHCSLFTKQSLGLALTRAGFRVTDLCTVFGGQYLWAEAVSGTGTWDPISTETPTLAQTFGQVESARRRYWDWALAEGPILVWGAGAKGVTFCNLVDPECDRVAAVVDVNPAKQGQFLAGTGHPILAPQAAFVRSPARVLVLNPNYRAEIAEAVGRFGSQATVFDLMAQEEVRAVHA